MLTVAGSGALSLQSDYLASNPSVRATCSSSLETLINHTRSLSSLLAGAGPARAMPMSLSLTREMVPPS